MNAELINKCDLFVKNRDTIQQAYPWNSVEMNLAGAAIYTGLGTEADVEKLKACEAILKKHDSVFSDYRGYVKMPLLCKMTMTEDPEQYLQQIKTVTGQMKQKILMSAEYKILAAMTICEHVGPEKYTEAAARSAEMFEEMKKNHPWLTGGEDIPFAAMLAVSDVDTAALTAEMEKCYQVLKERFYDADAVQSLSHVLAADPAEAEQKCAKVEKIFDLLKEKDHKYGSGKELPVLGVLALLDVPAEMIADDIVEADDYLKTQRGFGDFLMGTKIRRMYAALMTLDTISPVSYAATDSVVGSMLSLMIAMEILTISMISTSCISMVSSH